MHGRFRLFRAAAVPQLRCTVRWRVVRLRLAPSGLTNTGGRARGPHASALLLEALRSPGRRRRGPAAPRAARCRGARWVEASTTGAAQPSSWARSQLTAVTHQRSPGTSPGNRYCGIGRAQVVADRALVLEELRGDDGADRVAAEVLGTGGAAAVAVEARHRVGAARLQIAAEHVEVGHGRQSRVVPRQTGVVDGRRCRDPPPAATVPAGRGHRHCVPHPAAAAGSRWPDPSSSASSPVNRPPASGCCSPTTASWCCPSGTATSSCTPTASRPHLRTLTPLRVDTDGRRGGRRHRAPRLGTDGDLGGISVGGRRSRDLGHGTGLRDRLGDARVPAGRRRVRAPRHHDHPRRAADRCVGAGCSSRSANPTRELELRRPGGGDVTWHVLPAGSPPGDALVDAVMSTADRAPTRGCGRPARRRRCSASGATSSRPSACRARSARVRGYWKHGRAGRRRRRLDCGARPRTSRAGRPRRLDGDATARRARPAPRW